MGHGSENFWPTLCDKIKRWSEGCHQGVTKESLGIDSITCSICQQSLLAIAGFKSHQPRSLATGPQELGVVLACGHIVGQNCGTTWKMHGLQNLPTYSCPFCRFDLNPARCSRHQFADMISLTKGRQNFGILSRVVQKGLDEAREHLVAASSCRDCIIAKARDELGAGTASISYDEMMRYFDQWRRLREAGRQSAARSGSPESEYTESDP